MKQDATFPTVLRNLSLAYFNKLGKEEEAVRLLEKHSLWIQQMLAS